MLRIRQIKENINETVVYKQENSNHPILFTWSILLKKLNQKETFHLFLLNFKGLVTSRINSMLTRNEIIKSRTGFFYERIFSDSPTM